MVIEAINKMAARNVSKINIEKLADRYYEGWAGQPDSWVRMMYATLLNPQKKGAKTKQVNGPGGRGVKREWVIMQ